MVTLPLELRGLCRLLPRGALIPGIEDHILVLQAVQLVGETLAGGLKLDLLQEHLLGRAGQQLVQVAVIARLLSTGL